MRRELCRGGLLQRGGGLHPLAGGSSCFRLLHQEETSAYAVRFYRRLLEQYVERRTEFAAARGLVRYQEGLERLRLSQRLASAGMLGQFACIAEKPVQG